MTCMNPTLAPQIPSASHDFHGIDAPEKRLLSTLRTIDFPATKDDLLRIAVVDHLEVDTIGALRELPRRDYHGTADVLRALAS